MKKKSTAVIGMVVCFMMMATMAWAFDLGMPRGTVTDGNLVWLQNANCFGRQDWHQATSSAASLKSGSCGLWDGSKAGDWRLPTKDELVRRQKNLQGFNNVQASYYWSSSNYFIALTYAFFVGMHNGGVNGSGKIYSYYVWPVRSVQ